MFSASDIPPSHTHETDLDLSVHPSLSCEQSIFVPFFGHIWGDLRSELECASTESEDDEGRDDKKAKSKKRKRQETATPPSDPPSTSDSALSFGGLPLLELVLSSLQRCFEYDECGFLTPSRFEALQPLLVSLFTTLRGLTSDDDAAYRRIGEDLLVPCVSQMAAAVDKDVLWKPLNHGLLMKTRERDWLVRLLSLRAVHECFVAVGEEYLVMLPESISFFSELMEDEAPEVEAECKKAVAFIEELSGETLDSYLT